MDSSIVVPEFIDARVGPRGSLENLSQAEIGKLLDSGQGGLYRLFRRCALAVPSLFGLLVLTFLLIRLGGYTGMQAGAAMNAGPTAFRLGLRGWVPEAESSLVERDVQLAAETKAHYHVAHLSTAAALKAACRPVRCSGCGPR